MLRLRCAPLSMTGADALGCHAERSEASQTTSTVVYLGVFLSIFASPAAAEFTFEQYEVVLGAAERQTVLTGFLLGGAVAELVVVNVDENGDRRLHIYAFGDSSTWVPLLDAMLRPAVLFVDVAKIGGRDRLIAYESGRLNWFDPESATERALVAGDGQLQSAAQGRNPPCRCHAGCERRRARRFGRTGCRWLLGVCPDDRRRVCRSGEDRSCYRYEGDLRSRWLSLRSLVAEPRIYEVDYNGDGRRDLAFWNEDHFAVHLQDERGLFAAVAETFTTEVAFDSDDFGSLATGDMTGKVLHSLSDLNGDGVADLVTFSLEGGSIASKRSAFEVHFGAPTAEGGIAFARGVDIAFKSDGSIQLGMDRHDFDRDGQGDLMFKTIEVEHLESSLWKRFKGFMGDDIWLDLEFYRMEGGRYPDTPNAIRRIALDGVPSHREPGWVPLDIVLRGATHERRKTQKSWPRAFNTTLRIGDVTGDGLADLLIGDHPRIMDIFVGVPGPDLFAQRPQKVAVAVPNDEEYTWLVDLNEDGKQDVLMHHPFTLRDAHGGRRLPPGAEPHRVTVLIAR